MGEMICLCREIDKSTGEIAVYPLKAEVKGGIDDVKAEQREQRKTNTDFVGRLVSVEASAKQAHKRLDHIEQQISK